MNLVVLQKLDQNVFKVDDRDLSRTCVYKCTDKNDKLFEREAVILKKLAHPYIPKYLGFHNATLQGSGSYKTRFHIIEYSPGVDLLTFRLKTSIPDQLGKMLCKAILTGLRYAHSHNICHLDIKLDNIIYNHRDNWDAIATEVEIKIIDWDLAEVYPILKSVANPRGTFPYVPPEILDMDFKEIGAYNDIWSFGVTAFGIFTGCSPFARCSETDSDMVMAEEIRNYRILYDHNLIDLDCMGFLQKIFVPPNVRPSAYSLLKDRWFQNI